MSGFENIEARISEHKAKIDVINQALIEEKNKKYGQRRGNRILFLHAEKQAHSLALVELNDLLLGATGKGAEDEHSVFRQALTVSSIDISAREWKQAKRGKRIYRIFAWGGIGDTLLLTPAIRSLKQQYPDCKIYVYYRLKAHMEVLLHNKYIDRLRYWWALRGVFNYLLSLLGFAEVRYVNYGLLAPSLLYHAHASEIIGEMLGVKIDTAQMDCFLTREEEIAAKKIVERYPNPVSIQVTPGSSQNKRWPTENWEKLVINNPHYTFIQLGSSNDELIRGTVNMCGKTIRESFAIVKETKAFVGVDSAFGHAAAAFQKPAVILFGPSTPVTWGNATSKNLYNPPHCSPCIDKLLASPCPYGIPCMSNITVSEVEQALSSLMTAETTD